MASAVLASVYVAASVVADWPLTGSDVLRYLFGVVSVFLGVGIFAGSVREWRRGRGLAGEAAG